MGTRKICFRSFRTVTVSAVPRLGAPHRRRGLRDGAARPRGERGRRLQLLRKLAGLVTAALEFRLGKFRCARPSHCVHKSVAGSVFFEGLRGRSRGGGLEGSLEGLGASLVN